MVTFQLTDAIKNYMRHLMTITTNADVAYKIAKEEMQMTRAQVRLAWRETARSELYATLLKTWGTDRTPPAAWGTKADFSMYDKYLYTFDVKFYDLVTHEHIQKTIAAYQSERRSFSDVWDSMQKILKGYEAGFSWIVKEWSPAGLWVRE